MPINRIMHMYQDVKVDSTLFASADGFDYLVLAATESDKEEVLELSAYLRNFREKKRGRGTKKPGSVVYVTLDDDAHNIALDAIKNIPVYKIRVG